MSTPSMPNTPLDVTEPRTDSSFANKDHESALSFEIPLYKPTYYQQSKMKELRFIPRRSKRIANQAK